MLTGFDDDSGIQPDDVGGAGAVESVVQLVESSTRDSETDLAEIAMNGAAVGLDGLGFVMDPLGSLATAGIGWLIEHISFLREPLDWFAGNPDDVKAACAVWNDVARKLDDIGTQQDEAIKREVRSWEEAAAEAFRKSHGQLAQEMHAVGAACTSVSTQIANFGALVGAVRGMIRDLISTFVWEVIRNSVIALAGSAVTFGGAAAAFAAWAVGRGAMVLGKIAKYVAKIMGIVGRVTGRLTELFGKLGDLMKGLKRFNKGGSAPDAPAPTTVSNATDNATGTSKAGVGRRMEDWGRQKVESSNFEDAYKDAGNRWKQGYEEKMPNVPNKAQEAVEQYTPFKPKEYGDGSVSAHSRPDITNRGLVTKFSGDLAREVAKTDDMENEVSVSEGLSPQEEERRKQEGAREVTELREGD